MIEEIYKELLQLMEDMDYYTKYPTRRYLKEAIESAKTTEDKVRVILRDSLIQKEIVPDWLHARHTMGDPLEYYKRLREQRS